MRPVTAFDADWKNTCLLCTELPSLQNGMVKLGDPRQRRARHGDHAEAEAGPEVGATACR